MSQCDTDTPAAHTIASTTLEGFGSQEKTRSAEDKLKRHSQERSTGIGTQMGIRTDSGPQQTKNHVEVWPNASSIWTRVESRSRL